MAHEYIVRDGILSGMVHVQAFWYIIRDGTCAALPIIPCYVHMQTPVQCTQVNGNVKVGGLRSEHMCIIIN